MSIFLDEYIKLNGERQDLGTFTGKPIEFGGSLGRNEATGFGVVIATKFMAKKLGINLKDAKIGLQGFGNVGSFTLKYLEDEGAKIQYISIIESRFQLPVISLMPSVSKLARKFRIFQRKCRLRSEPRNRHLSRLARSRRTSTNRSS